MNIYKEKVFFLLGGSWKNQQASVRGGQTVFTGRPYGYDGRKLQPLWAVYLSGCALPFSGRIDAYDRELWYSGKSSGADSRCELYQWCKYRYVFWMYHIWKTEIIMRCYERFWIRWSRHRGNDRRFTDSRRKGKDIHIPDYHRRSGCPAFGPDPEY